LLGATASIVLAGTANAAHFKGWYVGLEGGANWIDDADATAAFSTGEGTTTTAGSISFDTGWAAIATVGYSYGEHWRAEIEGGYRSNDITSGAGSDVTEWSLMVNALYDFHLSPTLDLTLGAGAGYDWATLDLGGVVDDTDGNFAYQGIAGLSYAMTDRMDLTLTYRYLNVQGPAFDLVGLKFDVDDVTKHSVTVGLRFDLYPDEAPAAAPPPPPPPPPPPIAENFVIFFGFGKCNITGEADAVLSEAAAAAKSTGSASVMITGHTDSVGSAASNQKLSECRAGAAKSNLVGKGIAEGAITTSGKGESELMVQTGDGVKEPQNRRATIDLQ